MPAKPTLNSMRALRAHVIYSDASLRADSSVLGQNRQGQSGLWGYAISGDLPIVLLRIADAANIGWRASSYRPMRIGACTGWPWIS